MKYRILQIILSALIAVAITLSTVSCNKGETLVIPEEPKAETITLTATMELPDSETKTSLDGLNVKWSAEDKISVFFEDNTTNKEFTLSSGSGETSGIFTGEASQTSGTLYAVYPYNTDTSISGNTVSLTLPSVQTYKQGGFADGMNPAVAYTSDGGNLQFKNLCGILKLDLKYSGGSVQPSIRKIVIYSPTDKLSGGGYSRNGKYRS